MGETRHEKSFNTYDQPYEQNVVGLKGVVYFAVFLILLIVVTFGLMWALLSVLENNARETKVSDNPMQMSDREKLPPEPRLQAAPGFGVDSENGRVNLELQAPQSEYRELRKQWEETWKNGSVDPATGAVSGLPIEEAKAKIVAESPKTMAGTDAEKLIRQSQMSITDASSGRMSALKRR